MVRPTLPLDLVTLKAHELKFINPGLEKQVEKFLTAIFQKQSIEGFGFDVEILYIARKWGMKIKEVPVVWKHQEGSQVNLPLDAITMLWDLFKIKWADWQDQYEHG